MKRRLLKLGLLILAGAIISVASLSYYWPSSPSSSWSHALAVKVQHGQGTPIDFAEIAPVMWDRVYVFPPYTTNKKIDATLGFKGTRQLRSSINTSDGVDLVIFARDDAVVGWFDHPRDKGDLCPLADDEGYKRDEANFRVVVDSSGWSKLPK